MLSRLPKEVKQQRKIPGLSVPQNTEKSIPIEEKEDKYKTRSNHMFGTNQATHLENGTA